MKMTWHNQIFSFEHRSPDLLLIKIPQKLHRYTNCHGHCPVLIQEYAASSTTSSELQWLLVDLESSNRDFNLASLYNI